MNLKQEQPAGDQWRQSPLFAKSLPGILTVEQCEAIKKDALALGLNPAQVVKRGGGGTKRSPAPDIGRGKTPSYG